MSDLIASCIYLDPAVKSYLESEVRNPESLAYKHSYSRVINDAVAEHADREGVHLHLLPLKRAGRPSNSDTAENSSKSEPL